MAQLGLEPKPESKVHTPIFVLVGESAVINW